MTFSLSRGCIELHLSNQLNYSVAKKYIDFVWVTNQLTSYIQIGTAWLGVTPKQVKLLLDVLVVE